MGLTQARVDLFHAQGFLFGENVLTPDEIEAMRARVEQIARGEIPEGSRIKRQVEPGVAAGEKAASDYEASLRKMAGLALAGDDVFEAHAKRPRIVEMIQALLGPDLTLYQDQLFMKPARVGSRQPYHQDQPAGFHIDPPEALVTVWTALDDSTEENGCRRRQTPDVSRLPRRRRCRPSPQRRICRLCCLRPLTYCSEDNSSRNISTRCAASQS